MTAEIFVEFGFEAAHRLPNVPEGHKCARLHGHSFRFEVHLEGEIGAESGWVIDYAEVREAARGVRDELDHRYLNEIAGLENPTSEVLARWIWERLEGVVPGLAAIVLRETCTTGCIYRGS